jgi:ABC-type transport system substrate-binding protein
MNTSKRSLRSFSFFCLVSAILAVGAGALFAPGTARAAPAKGTFYLRLEEDPSTLNPVTSTDAYVYDIHDLVFDTLLLRSDETYEWLPEIAEKWDVSKDGKTYTFKIRPGVKWHDGQPLTAEDVKYSYDVYFEGRFQAPTKKVYFEKLKEVKVLDPLTVQFICKDAYYKNLEVLASYVKIVPKHIYGQIDPADPRLNREIVGTGPYQLQEWNKGQRIVLKHVPEYWAADLPYYKERYKFDKIVFRVVRDDTVAMEMLKKGDLDYLDLRLQPERFAKDTQGPEWGTKVFAVKAQNDAPQMYGYGFIGWNLKNPFFRDRLVRQALSHMINRPLMIEKFRFGLSELAVGPFGNRSPSTSPKVKPVPYDPKKALALLKKAGWKLDEGGLTKEMDGNPTHLEFTLICANPNFEKYLTLIKEDLKAVGITMNIKMMEWNSLAKALDERKFEAATLGWTVNSMDDDPVQIWHSKSIPSPGSNFIGYANPAVDRLIDEVQLTLDRKKRIAKLHRVHELIAEDQPYSFLFNQKYWLYVNSNRVEKPSDTLKYAIGWNTWSIKASASGASGSD